jgi:hypothetical protein
MRRLAPGLIATAVATLIVAGCQPTPSLEAPPENQVKTPKPQSSVLELTIGDCVMDAEAPLSADLTELPTVPCSEPHDSELYAIVFAEDGNYPGVDELVAQGQAKCQSLFGDFVGIDFRSSLLDFHFYYPTPSSWVQGDRSIYCMVADPGVKVVGSLQGSQR